MKYIYCVIYSLLFFNAIYAQNKVNDFYSIMTTRPVQEEIHLTEFEYDKNGEFLGLKERNIMYSERREKSKIMLAWMGLKIDDLNLIDYESDTIVFVDIEFLKVEDIVRNIFKLKDNFLDVQIDSQDLFRCDSRDISYDLSEKPKIIYDEIMQRYYYFLNTALSWDIKMLTQMVKTSGPVFDRRYYNIERIIVKDNQVISIERISVKDPHIWNLPDINGITY